MTTSGVTGNGLENIYKWKRILFILGIQRFRIKYKFFLTTEIFNERLPWETLYNIFPWEFWVCLVSICIRLITTYLQALELVTTQEYSRCGSSNTNSTNEQRTVNCWIYISQYTTTREKIHLTDKMITITNMHLSYINFLETAVYWTELDLKTRRQRQSQRKSQWMYISTNPYLNILCTFF